MTTTSDIESGILLVNKPVGMTSFQVVSRIRKLCGVRKAGHCGTLDPFASGLLPVAVGRATRVVRYMDSYDKTYRCRVRFGAFTDTQDRDGVQTGGRLPTDSELRALEESDYEQIRRLILNLSGDRMQIPPMYSAVKSNGKPLYAYARQGITLERSERPIRIHHVEVHAIGVDEGLYADFSVSCSKGTYIRTLCDDLGRESGFGAYADALIRTRCGPYPLSDSHTLEELEEKKFRGELADLFLPEDSALSHLPSLFLSEEEEAAIRMGKLLDLSLFASRMTDCTTGVRTVVRGNCGPIAVVYPDIREGREILRIERVFS